MTVRIGPLTGSAVVASISSATPTLILEWPGPDAGVLTALYAASLALGDSALTVYVLPAGTTAGSDAYVFGAKALVLTNNKGIDYQLTTPVYLQPGDAVYAIVDVASRATVWASAEAYQQ